MSEAFHQAWALLKMPYHGTDLRSAAKIMNEGTKAQKDKRPTFQHLPASFFMAEEPEEARYHARKKALRTGSPPVILNITDEGVQSVPHRIMNEKMRMPTIITHGYPHKINPKHISIHATGPEPIDFENYRTELREAGW
jgi:hypothetical protein